MMTITLWPEGAPGALGTDAADIPTLTAYVPLAGTATGAAIVVCPGGGYGMLADHEGEPIAHWLNTLGITAFVLRYRLGPRYRHPVMHQDAARALRTVRARAGEWQLDINRVGILGFSAGGHLASTAATHFDSGHPDSEDPIEHQNSRPNAAILIYPVITMLDPHTHSGSRQNLLGDAPASDLVALLSNETQVTPQTPPTFLIHTNEDGPVPAENSLLFALALRAAGVPLELHLYERGAHGFGLAESDPILRTWPALCADWLRGHGFAHACA